MQKYIPLDTTIAFTYKCNSRCQMCNIWQIKDAPDLSIEFLKNLSPELKYINLSGGEIFLRKDLPEIISVLKKQCPKAQLIISSNGFATAFILETMKKIKEIDAKIGVRISLDGVGKTHNVVRGIPNAYNLVLKTIDGLKKIGINNLGFSFTVMGDNANDLIKVYDLSKELKVELAIAVVQNSGIYFQKEDNKIDNKQVMENALDQVVKRELKTWKLKSWLRAYYDYGLIYHLLNNKRLMPTGAGMDSLFIDPLGNIYPSNLINIKMGNLADGQLDELWNSDKFNQIRSKMIKDKVTEPWIICTLRGEMKKRWWRVIWWIFKNKLINLV